MPFYPVPKFSKLFSLLSLSITPTHTTDIAPGGFPDAAPAVDDKPERPLTTHSFDGLQKEEARRMFDLVDKLRSYGVGEHLSLPQLVFCGDQSAGKSSVLHALTGIPFPSKEGFCTRFPTEIVLRQDVETSIRATIVPDSARSEAEQARLREFNQALSTFNELPKMMDLVTDLMGLSGNEAHNSPPRAMAKDRLRIEVTGREHSPLSLIDLPGLVSAAVGELSDEDVELSKQLTLEFLDGKRTIILPVVSAGNQFALQHILDMYKRADPEGIRTLGIITKPDCAKPGSTAEQMLLECVQNKTRELRYGWHVVKNPSEDSKVSEDQFLAQVAYQRVSPKFKGAPQLRHRLADLALKISKEELPTVESELDKLLSETVEELSHLGEDRSTVAEQRRFLTKVSIVYQEVIEQAVNGHYGPPSFAKEDMSKRCTTTSSGHNLYAAIDYQNQRFATQMIMHGQKFKISMAGSSSDVEKEEDDERLSLAISKSSIDDSPAAAEEGMRSMSREDALSWANDLLLDTKGRELPGLFNPVLVDLLFWEQSERWRRLASEHVNHIGSLCSEFVKSVLTFACGAATEVADRLYQAQVNKALKIRREAASEVLNRLIKDNKRRLMTYDPNYAAKVKAVQIRRLEAESMHNGPENKHNPDQIAAADALDHLHVYHHDAVLRFVENVIQQSIHRHLLDDLAKETFSPLIVVDMEDREVSQMAAESEKVKQRRKVLKERQASLEAGRAELQSALVSG